MTIDYAARRIWRDSFWKGSFAKDSLLGREERLRDALLDGVSSKAALNYTGGSFWKRFDSIQDGEAAGYVVNYELQCLPGRPMVKQIKYPDNNRNILKPGTTYSFSTISTSRTRRCMTPSKLSTRTIAWA